MSARLNLGLQCVLVSPWPHESQQSRQYNTPHKTRRLSSAVVAQHTLFLSWAPLCGQTALRTARERWAVTRDWVCVCAVPSCERRVPACKNPVMRPYSGSFCFCFWRIIQKTQSISICSTLSPSQCPPYTEPDTSPSQTCAQQSASGTHSSWPPLLPRPQPGMGYVSLLLARLGVPLPTA